MTKIDTIAVHGKSGEASEFDVYPKGTSFIDVGAVYLMLTKSSSGNYTLSYVGQTEQLGTRLDNHEKWPCADSHGVNCIGVLTSQNVTHRLNLETDIRQRYDPPCNRQ